MAAEPQVYEFLAQALLYPDAAFADKMRARGHLLAGSPPWATAIVAALDEEPLVDLQAEHIRLFVNAYGGTPCLPYESVRLEGRVLGEAAHTVMALYNQWGVEQTGEMPDHAAVELAFAGQLARLLPAIESPEEQDLVREALDSFERDHLRSWLPGLAADLGDTAGLAFYRALGAALQEVFGPGAAVFRPERRAAASFDLFQDGSV